MATDPRRRAHLRDYGNRVTGEAEVRIVRLDDGTEVGPGDTVLDLWGNGHRLRQATRFHSPELGKCGKVVVTQGDGHDGEYHEAVFGLRVELVKPQARLSR